MQIRIDIDVKPEELRRFLGLPDVAGLQEDLIAFLREKMESAGEFDPAAFVKGNLDTLRKNPTWQRLMAAAKSRVESSRAGSDRSATADAEAPSKSRERSGSGSTRSKSSTARRSRKSDDPAKD